MLIFYTEKLLLDYLLLSVILLVLLFGYNFIGGKKLLVYLLVGVLIWIFVLKSGIHSTIAGVLLAMTIPASKKINLNDFTKEAKYYFDSLTFQNQSDQHLEVEIHHSALKQLEELCINTETPLQRLEHSLAPWIALLIVPLFAFANAGVDLSLLGNLISFNDLIVHPVFLGILIALIIGNPIGINLLIHLALRLKFIKLPSGVNSIHVLGVSCLAGVGFTMSHFIASLAFTGPENILVLNIARFVILIGSVISGLLGFLILYYSENLSNWFIKSKNTTIQQK